MTDVVLVREPAPPPSVILVHTPAGTDVLLPPEVPPTVVVVEAVRGPQGMQGSGGVGGVQGPLGMQGPQGVQGQRGTQGPQGVQGVGMQGVQGEFVTGPQGPQGDQGIPGVGVAGSPGLQGPPGTQGVAGGAGTQGPQGRQGAAGSAGIGTQGAAGPQGPAGSPGTAGSAGSPGPQGPQGVGFAPGGDINANNVTAAGTVLSVNLPASAMKDIAAGNYSITARNDVGGPAVMTFHRGGSYASYLGIDNDNTWKVGGWSMVGVSYALLHEGNSFQLYTGGLNSGPRDIFTPKSVIASMVRFYPVDPVNVTSAFTVDWYAGSVQRVQLQGPTTLSILNVPSGNTLRIILFANGQTVAWNAPIYWKDNTPPNLNGSLVKWAIVSLTAVDGNFFGKADVF